MADGGRIVNATDNACRVISALQRLESAQVTELADELEYATSAVHAQLNTLSEHGFVVKEDGEYRLSFRFLSLSRDVLSRFGDFGVIRSEVDQLAEATQEVSEFATSENGRLRYLHKASGEEAVKTGSYRGKQDYLHSTAAGKAILSTMSENEIDDVIARQGLPNVTEQTIDTSDELLTCLGEIRERGYASSDEENVRGLRSVAMPVMSSKDNTIGAVSITGPMSRMTEKRFESELRESLLNSVNIIEVNYKFSQ